jgi:hypothetical protein
MNPNTMRSILAQGVFITVPAILGLHASLVAAVLASVAVAVLTCGFVVAQMPDAFRFHRGSDDRWVICMDHHHLHMAPAAFAFLAPRSFSATLATLAVAVTEAQTVAVAMVVALVAELSGFAFAALAGNAVLRSVWREDARSLDRMSDGESPIGRPKERPLRDSLKDFDNHLGQLLAGETPPAFEAGDVGVLEDWLVSVLVFRGLVAGTDRRLVNAVHRELSFDDPEQRRQWRCMPLNRATWLNVRRSYQSFAIEVLRRQNDSTRVTDRPPEVGFEGEAVR